MMDSKGDGILKVATKETVKTKKDVTKTRSAKALYNGEIAKKILEGMSREQFHKKVVRGVALSPAFGALVTFGADSLSAHDKITVRTELAKISITYDMTQSDESLNKIAKIIANRSVRLE